MGHDNHHHDDDHHGHGHDDHHEAKYLPYNGQRVKDTPVPMPPMGSTAYDECSHTIDDKKNVELPIRTNSDRLISLLRGSVRGHDSAAINAFSAANNSESTGFWDSLFHPLAYPMPRTYTSPYVRPNPCPEVHWWNPWRWPRFRVVNAKVAPPIEGAYNDHYHYLAFKYWLDNERAVYYQSTQIQHEIVLRCLAKEGRYNGWKNCKHLLNKEFAMGREAEHNQMLMYMAVTGNAAIRETPYPEDFVEQKRKIYDNWLFRTRMRKPGDFM